MKPIGEPAKSSRARSRRCGPRPGSRGRCRTPPDRSPEGHGWLAQRRGTWPQTRRRSSRPRGPRNRSSNALTACPCRASRSRHGPSPSSRVRAVESTIVSYQERRQHSVEATALRRRERRTRLPVDRDPRLITHDPRVVAGQNLIELPASTSRSRRQQSRPGAVAPVDHARPDLLAVEQVGETLVARSGRAVQRLPVSHLP